MTQQSRDEQVRRYIGGIRNANKRAYAHLYYGWLIAPTVHPQPVAECSTMAAQAVRLAIQDLLTLPQPGA